MIIIVVEYYLSLCISRIISWILYAYDDESSLMTIFLDFWPMKVMESSGSAADRILTF